MYENEIREALGLDESIDVSEANVHEGKLTDYAEELADTMLELTTLAERKDVWLEFSRRYFDAEQLAYDLMLGGDVVPWLL